MSAHNNPHRDGASYNEPPSDTVILYSGGLDSLIAAHLLPHARLVYIDTGAQYAWKETANLSNAPRKVWLDKRLNLSDKERDDGIVPARNALLAIIGSYYADNIVLVSTAGDRSTDKDERWAAMMSEVLTHMYGLPHFNPPRTVRVLLPFKELSKGQLVEQYLAASGDPQALVRAVSCYSSGAGHCGVCKACIRKWVALDSNGIRQTAWSINPWEAHYETVWKPVVEAIKAGGWRCVDEDRRTLQSLAAHGVI